MIDVNTLRVGTTYEMEGMDERDGTHQVWTITGTGSAKALLHDGEVPTVQWRNETSPSMFRPTGTWEAWRFAWRAKREVKP
jgi:hypothetical protein